MIILATDSGIERTGYAFFDKSDQRHELIHYGCIITEKNWSIEKRLEKIYDDLTSLLVKYHPEKIIIERLFFNTNQKTAVSIAQSQGVLLLLAAKHHLSAEFLTPLQVKYILTGYGRSDKTNVRKMVQLLLRFDILPKLDDIVDAIACGLAYCTLKKLKT